MPCRSGPCPRSNPMRRPWSAWAAAAGASCAPCRARAWRGASGCRPCWRWTRPMAAAPMRWTGWSCPSTLHCAPTWAIRPATPRPCCRPPGPCCARCRPGCRPATRACWACNCAGTTICGAWTARNCRPGKRWTSARPGPPRRWSTWSACCANAWPARPGARLRTCWSWWRWTPRLSRPMPAVACHRPRPVRRRWARRRPRRSPASAACARRGPANRRCVCWTRSNARWRHRPVPGSAASNSMRLSIR